MKHKEQREYVDRTQRQYETALTRALKIKKHYGINFSLAILCLKQTKKGKGRPYSITERRVPELIPVLGSQPAVVT